MLLPNRACQVKQFALRDAQGRLHTTEEWRGRKGVVLFFLEPDCPVVNDYAPAMQRLAERRCPGNRVLWGLLTRQSIRRDRRGGMRRRPG